MVTFRSVDAARDFALSFQRNSGAPRTTIRAGIHVGPVIIKGSLRTSPAVPSCPHRWPTSHRQVGDYVFLFEPRVSTMRTKPVRRCSGPRVSVPWWSNVHAPSSGGGGPTLASIRCSRVRGDLLLFGCSYSTSGLMRSRDLADRQPHARPAY
jgi:hypothetical protein